MASSAEDKQEAPDDGTGTETKNGVEDTEAVLDLSGRRLKRLEKAPNNQTFATALVLDNNNLQNLSNLDSYGELERLSIANNQIIRMYWFARMYSVRILNLPNNNIVQIEGLRELHHLIHVNLSGNNIKAIEGVSHSHKLEHLNLSGNFITQICDLSMLKNLKELFLHRNRISTLHRCNKYLPTSLFILTLSDNNISDLNDLSNISHLTNLEQFTILNNPALEPLHQVDENGDLIEPPLEFDNRPYVINWCLNLKVLDGYKVTPKESLKAEWLYSQGKGRSFQIGEHAALVLYLSGICLAGGGWGGADLPDEDDKLGKILQLAKQHQQELRHSVVNGHDNSDSSSGRGSRGSNNQDSPASLRRSVARSTSLKRNTAPTRPAESNLGGHKRSSTHSGVLCSSTVKPQLDTTSHSYHVELSSTLYGGDLRTPDTPGLMTQSMDPSLLSQLSAEFHSVQPQAAHPMSKSLGPEQMALSLQPDQMLSYSVGGLNEPKNTNQIELMSQSLGPEQLKMSLSLLNHQPNSERWDQNRCTESSTRVMKHFYEDSHSGIGNKPMNNLNGIAQFAPVQDLAVNRQCKISTSSRIGSSQPLISRTVSRSSSSSQRQKSTLLKSPAPEIIKGSPRSQHRSLSMELPPPCSIGNMSPRSKLTPKPAPRASRTNLSGVSNSLSSSSVCNKVSRSPTTPSRISEGESDNTDSEFSASKLKNRKLIALEKKCQDKRSAFNNLRSVDDVSFSQGINSHPHIYNPDKYRNNSQSRSQSRGRVNSNSSGASLESRGSSKSHIKTRGVSSMSVIHAAITLQRYWRGYSTRYRNPKVAKLREEIRQSRAEQHIRYLSEKLKSAEFALARERKLRHLQLDAIRTLWREIQKLQAGRTKDNTPSTPMTPITPLTPLEISKKIAPTNRSKLHSEENVKELTVFCSSLQSQVSELQQSLSMVTQVMNAFCHLPGSQSLLTMSLSSGGSGVDRSIGDDEDGLTPSLSQGGGMTVSLSQSVTTFTNSILALTSNIVQNDESQNTKESKITECPPHEHELKVWTSSKQGNGIPMVNAPELAASITSLASIDMNSTGQDVSTLSNDSNEGEPESHLNQQEAELSDSSQSSLSASLSGSHHNNGGLRSWTAPLRPSSLPVARPHTPRSNS